MHTHIKRTATALAVFAGTLASINAAAAEPIFPDRCKGDMPMSNMPMGGQVPMGGQMPMGGNGAGPMGDLNDHQKASMEGMVTMNQQMMQGMLKDDADVSFACGMIAHHMGAIKMAEIELEYGDNDEAKAFAQKTIEEQTKEIEELSAWVEKEVKE